LSVSRARFDVVEEVKTALFAMFFLVGAVSAQAGNLDALKATAKKLRTGDPICSWPFGNFFLPSDHRRRDRIR